MPAFLKQDIERDILTVSLGGLKGPDFQDALARVKSIPGRRFNGETKNWEFQRSPDTALRLMNSLHPTADPGVQSLVREAAEQVATQLLTRLPDDAELSVPWADRLFPFQRSGVDWMCEHPRSLLADEMGLGKTIQALTLRAEYLARYGKGTAHDGLPSLVVAPKVLRKTWAREAELGPVDRQGKPLFPEWEGIGAQVVDGRTPKKRLAQLEEPADLYVINWEAMWREPIIDALLAKDWLAIFADEAHRAKNRKAKQFKDGLRKLHAPIQLAITGTPIMNTPDELWSLLAWLYPKQYTSFWAFHNNYVDEYIAGGTNQRVMVGVKNPDALRFELSDKMVRRRKVDVLKDLPPKLPPKFIDVELTPAQRKLYQETEKALFLDAAGWIKGQVEEGGADVEGLAEELADMPLDRLIGLVPNAAARIAKLRQITAAAKAAVADELIREEPDEPVVAFTWHVDIAHQLADALRKGPPGLRVGIIAGTADGSPVEADFQAGRLDHVVCTIAKGGAGLTLTRSSDPIFVEEDWTPAINDQAVDRTHRVGQTRPVTPRILRCPGTVDDGKVAPRLEFKRGIVAQVMGS